MKRAIAVAAGLAAILSVSPLTVVTADAQTTFIRIGTGNQTGSWPPLGIQMAKILNAEVEGVNATSLLGAGAENLKNIENGRLEIGFSTTGLQAAAVEGSSPFTGELEKPRHLFSMYPIVAQFAVAKDSSIQSYSDLTTGNHRINANTKGSTTYNVLQAILAAHDITFEDISSSGGVVTQVGYADGVAQMQDGIVEMTGAIGPVPHNVILQVTENPGVRLLAMDPAMAEKAAASLPGYFATTVEGGSYKGVDDDVLTVALGTTALVSADLSEDLVFEMMTALFDNIGEVQGLFPAAASITLENGPTNNLFPLHPGAKRFYESRGIKVN